MPGVVHTHSDDPRLRLNATDSFIMADICLALLKLEDTADSVLPAETGGHGPVALFSSAYVAARKNDFTAAAAILRECREVVPPAVFSTVLDSPVFRKFSGEPALAAFYK